MVFHPGSNPIGALSTIGRQQEVASVIVLPKSAELEPLEQALYVVELDIRPEPLAQTLAKDLEDFTRALRIDFIGNFDAGAEIGPFGSLRTTERVERRIACTPHSRWHLAHHLFGHLLGARPQLLQCLCLLVGGAAQITLAQSPFGIFHRTLGTVELVRRLHSKAAEPLAQAIEPSAQFALALAESIRRELLALLATPIAAGLPALAIAWPLALAALPTLLASLATLLLALLLSLLARTLGSEGVVHKLLLASDEITELVHHLHHLPAAALLALAGPTHHAA